MTLPILLLTLGSVLRVTRLAVTDTITQPFRHRLALRYAQALTEVNTSPEPRRDLVRRAERRLLLVQLFECPWCIGFWISLVAACVAYSPVAHTLWFQIPALALSLSYLTGLAFTHLES
jgi:hypothetical protein